MTESNDEMFLNPNFGYSVIWNIDAVGLAAIILACKCGQEIRKETLPGDDGDITCSSCSRVYNVEWVGVEITEV